MNRLAPRVVCWGYKNRDYFPLDRIPYHLLQHHAKPLLGMQRWNTRARNLASGNFFGTVGVEKAALLELLAKTRPRVILCQYGTCSLRLLPVANREGVPLVAHFHGHDISSKPLKDKWYRWSLRKALRSFAAIVVVNEHQQEWMHRHGADQERIFVIPCGVPVGQFREARLVQEQPCRFLAVGRFVDKKSPLDTLRAFASCLRRNEGVSLRMVGDGPLREAAGKLAADLQVDRQVTFLGEQSNEGVRNEMERAGVFLQHSVTAPNGNSEGWPVSIGEAVASGLPVVATRHAAIPRQVEHGATGFLVAEHDWRAMGEAMSTLARSPQMRADFGRRARRLAVDRFDIQKQVGKLEDVLLRCCS